MAVFLKSTTRGYEIGKGGGDGGKIKWKLFEVNTKAVSREDELIGKFKMVVGDVISIKGQVMEFMYIPTFLYSCQYKSVSMKLGIRFRKISIGLY